MEEKGFVAAKTGEELDGNFDDLLSKELLKLSVQDRNHILEEAHGVRCMAPEETPYLVEESLKKLAIEIDEKIPNSQKKAYMLSQQRPASKAFINSREFRMRFLRLHLFDCKLAAERLVRVCNALLELFGQYALERPVRLSDFSNAELKVIRKGRLQPLPFRDRSGRRIGIMFPGGDFLKERLTKKSNSATRVLQIKLFMYFSWVMGVGVDAQRKGAIFVVWFDSEILESVALDDIKSIESTDLKSHSVSMLRGSVIHICSPDRPFYRVQRSILSLGAGYWRKRLKSHLGEAVELRYILDGYGINTDTLPISWTGNVKVGYLKQWMRIRQHLEDPSFRSQYSCGGCKFCSSNDSNNNQRKSQFCKFSLPIECPYLNDIVFKKGKSAKQHPGNAHFRSRIQTKYVELYTYSPGTVLRDPTTGIIKVLVDCFCDEVQRGDLRVLMWNEKMSWWSIVMDENVIRKKIEKTVISAVESISLPLPEKIPIQDNDLLEPNNCFNRCGREERSQDLQNGAHTWRSNEHNNASKRRKLAVHDTTYDFNATGSLSPCDSSDDNCSLKRCFS